MNDENTNAMPQADINRLSIYFPTVNWTECFWGFFCYSRQEYAGLVPINAVDEIMLGVHCVGGGCLCELAFCWHMITDIPIPRLEVFSDAWKLLGAPTFVEVLGQLARLAAENKVMTPDAVSALLIEHGFQDRSDQPLETAHG